jgi:hypothetical protein
LTSPVHQFFPILAVCCGSLADRFSASTGPDAGPVSGSTGWSNPVLATLIETIKN